MIRGVENSRALPRVLDDVHRRARARYHIENDFATNIEMSWQDITKLESDPNIKRQVSKDNLTSFVEFAGKLSIGVVLGAEHCIKESSPTDYELNNATEGVNDGFGDWLYRREIEIATLAQSSPLTYYSRILMLRDSPPLAVHGDKWGRAFEHILDSDKTMKCPSDALIIATVRRLFGDEAVELLSEEVSGNVIAALTNDKPEAVCR